MNDSNSNNKLTYAQVAASPPSDENELKSTGEADEQLTERNLTTTGGAHFSKQKSPKVDGVADDGAKNGQAEGNPGKNSISSTGSSEPEIINVEPPIPPPVDKMKKPQPPPQPAPEPVKPKPDEPAKKNDEPPIVDKVADDFAPLKHTTMLTKKGEGVNNGGTAALTNDDEFEVVSDETEKRRRNRTLALIAGSGLVVIGILGFGIWKWTSRGRANN